MIVRRLAIALVAVAAVLALPAAASACTCASTGDAVEDAVLVLEDSDAAFIGVLKSVRPVGGGEIDENPDSTVIAVYRYRVRKDFGAKLGEHVRIRSRVAEASCGLPTEAGDRFALGHTERRGDWTSDLCALMRPKALRKAAADIGFDRDGGGGGCA